VRRRAVLMVAEGPVQSNGVPTGEAAAFMIRPTTTPSASTS
jgi:hypothetical protein